MKDFKSKVVVITGAGSGMGRSYALEFARLGAKLALNDYDADALEQTVALLRSSARPYTRAFDVSDGAQMEGFAAEVQTNLGKAHVLINNAGISGAAKPTWALPRDAFERTMQVNFGGVVNGVRAFLPQLLDNSEGAIVNVASVFGLVGVPNCTDYCASKFAVRGFSEALTIELLNTHVSVHTVCPGGIRTNIAGATELGKQFAQRYLKTSPDVVAKRVVQAIRDQEPLVLVGHNARRIDALARLVPAKLRQHLLYKTMGLPLQETEEYRRLLR